MFSTLPLMAVLGTTFLLVTVGTLWYVLPMWKSVVKTDGQKSSIQHEVTYIGMLVVVYGAIITLTHYVVSAIVLDDSNPLAVYTAVWGVVALTHVHSGMYEKRSWRAVVAAVCMQAFIIVGGGIIISIWP